MPGIRTRLIRGSATDEEPTAATESCQRLITLSTSVLIAAIDAILLVMFIWNYYRSEIAMRNELCEEWPVVVCRSFTCDDRVVWQKFRCFGVCR